MFYLSQPVGYDKCTYICERLLENPHFFSICFESDFVKQRSKKDFV